LQNLRVGHSESDSFALNTGLEHNFLDEISKVTDTVALNNLNLLK
jgi:hypothetical protein